MVLHKIMTNFVSNQVISAATNTKGAEIANENVDSP
jgi:hypothetical protein